jgi:hypothetical protein
MGTQKLLKKGYLRTYDPVRVTLPRLGVKGSQVQILSARQCDLSTHRKLSNPQGFGSFPDSGVPCALLGE